MNDAFDKLRFAKLEIKNEIKDAIPPELKVAMRLWLWGVTEQEFNDMKADLDISDPVHIKILNHLRDEWKNREEVLNHLRDERKNKMKNEGYASG